MFVTFTRKHAVAELPSPQGTRRSTSIAKAGLFSGEGVAGAAPEHAGSTRVAAARNTTTMRAPGTNIGLLVPGASV